METDQTQQNQQQPNLIVPVGKISEESLKKLKDNENFKSYAYVNLLRTLTESQGSEGSILAEARVYANMLKSVSAVNRTLTQTQI